MSRTGFFVALAIVSVTSVASAAEFDDRGVFVPDAEAVDFEDFSAPERHVAEDAELPCIAKHFEVITDDALALEGDAFVRVDVAQDCHERFVITTPASQGSYRASVWMRHGSGDARLVAEYPEESGEPQQTARMAPTGRATSDGWIELASNDVPIDGTLAPLVYFRFTDFASAEGVDVDAFELVASGTFQAAPECDGVGDVVCGDDAFCLGGRCRLGGPNVPPLPDVAIRDEVVDALEFKLRIFFGGQKTRALDLPTSLATLESIRGAPTAWQFWNGWARSIRELHDWHTSARGPIGNAFVRGRLNACFIEGDADLSHDVWPTHPVYKDILVSHAGADGAAGLHAGDRLVAIDGQHPIEWARNLIDVNWGYHVACDDQSFADFAEALGGGGLLILKYAKTLSVVRCDPKTLTCADSVELIAVKDLTNEGVSPGVACDNRPSYHLGANSPSAENHYVYYTIFQGPVDGTTPEEAIHGMVWDTLYGGGDPDGYVNGTIRDAVAEWKLSARGVILDHRAGNGGTIDAPEFMTQLVRPEQVLAVYLMPMETAGFPGPATAEEGIQLFNNAKFDVPYTVGAADHDPALPVALITHRDGSASDYLPLGIKGSPKAKIFGPGPSAGAFSTFIQFSYWGGISFQLASGDTITNEGVAMIGKGVMPDFIVQQRQSDLLNGVDTIHEAALAWVRQELKP